MCRAHFVADVNGTEVNWLWEVERSVRRLAFKHVRETQRNMKPIVAEQEGLEAIEGYEGWGDVLPGFGIDHS